MADLSSILGGMVQGFKDFGTGLVDFFGTGAANIGDIASSIATGRATTKNQDDFRKWLYQTDDKQDAAAKGLGTILNGVSTVADYIPGAQAVTANPLFNGIQGAIGGVADELKMNGENADWGRAAQRAGVGAASGLASGYAGQALGKSGNKLLSNGLTRGAVSGALGGGIANAGYTGIEGGSVQDMINAGLYGAQTGALVGGTTGLARELIKPAHRMDVALSDDERKARIANIDDQLGKLDLSTPEGNARYNELTQARQEYSGSKPKTVADLMNEPKQKTVADLMLSPDDDVMASKINPGQLDLFSQPKQKPTAKKATKADEQLDLFSQPRPVEPENPYAPVDGQVTQAMRDRATDIMKNYENGLPENELYNRIDPETLPKGYAEIREIVDNVEPQDFGKMSFEELLDEVYRDKPNKEAFKDTDRYFYEEDMKKARRKAAALGIEVPKSFVSDTEKRLRDGAEYNFRKKIKEQIKDAVTPDDGILRPEVGQNIEYIIPGRDTFRKGFEAAADAALSERLGIAPGNTPKQTGGTFDSGTALGRYKHVTGRPDGNIKLRKNSRDLANPEDAISVVAHERLHSFQNETDNEPIANTRYDSQVTNAYKQLRDDLKDYYKSTEDIQKRYGDGQTSYWGDKGEQESRMLQQYLENKGYTQSKINVDARKQYGGTEWGNEINPAFDKFFDKLRALSKKGVALPALSALFGGGAIMAATQGDDKKKKSEVK